MDCQHFLDDMGCWVLPNSFLFQLLLTNFGSWTIKLPLYRIVKLTVVVYDVRSRWVINGNVLTPFGQFYLLLRWLVYYCGGSNCFLDWLTVSFHQHRKVYSSIRGASAFLVSVHCRRLHVNSFFISSVVIFYVKSLISMHL